MQPECLNGIGQTFCDSAMCAASALTTFHKSTCSPAGSPVRISAALAQVPELTGPDLDCGLSLLASFASYDPAMRCWKTFQRSFIEDSAAFSAIWPRSGMTRSGNAYQLPPLARRTDVIGSSLWPTPTVNGNNNRAGLSAKSGDGLATAVKRWPTPNATDGSKAPKFFGRGNPSLPQAVKDEEQTDGQLNPMWVEWLMGFPIGWTDLEG